MPLNPSVVVLIYLPIRRSNDPNNKVAELAETTLFHVKDVRKHQHDARPNLYV